MAIGKLVKGGGAGGLMSYLLADHDNSGEPRPRADIIGGTFSGRTEQEVSREFGEFHQLRPSLGQHVAHMSLNFPDNERDLSDSEMCAIGEHWATGMGFDGYSIVSHGDHIHIAASRIKLDGTTVSDSWDWRTSEALVREIEEKFDLIKVEPSHLLEPERSVDHVKAPGMAELALAEEGEAPVKAQLQDMLTELLKEPITASEFVQRLEEAGVDVRPNLANTGRLNGFSYGFEGSSFTAKELGRGFTLGNMSKRGFEYEQDRDFQTLQGARDRSKEREHLRTDRRHEGSDQHLGEPDPERGADRENHPVRDEPDARADGSRDPAAGGSTGQAEQAEQGSDHSDVESRESEPEATSISDHRTQGAEQNSGHQAPEVGGGAAGAPGRAEPSQAPKPAGRGGGGGAGVTGSHGGSPVAGVDGGDFALLEGDGFAALSSFFKKWAAAMKRANPGISIPKPPAMSPEPGSAYDRILELAGAGEHAIRERKIAEQLSAFGVQHFEVQAIPPKGSDLRIDSLRTVDAAGLMNLRSYLAHKNRNGYDIYVRPAKVVIDGKDHGQPYVFVDDLDAAKVKKLEAAGLPLAVSVESSPGNFHGWIRVGDKPLPAPELTKSAQIVARAIGADPGAADWRHFGRLAGYTNQKPQHRKRGQQPFVKVTGTQGHLIAKSGPGLLAAARQELEKEQDAMAARTASIDAQKRRQNAHSRVSGSDVFETVKEARERLRKGTDESATDFAAAMSALRKGFSESDVKDALHAVSPDIEKRHRDVDRYLEETVQKAAQRLDQGRGLRR